MKNYWLEKRELRLHERWQTPSIDETIWMPIRPSNLTTEEQDLEYFKNKLFHALKMPKEVEEGSFWIPKKEDK